MKLKECENFVVLGVFLGVVGLFSALVLALVSGVTAPAIEKADQRAKKEALEQLGLGEFDNDPTAEKEKCKFDGVTFMALRKGGKLVGIAAESETGGGYAGTIRELVGFEPDGTIRTVLITDEKETPGLGKNVCERRNKKTVANFWKPEDKKLPPNAILDQYSGRKAGDDTKWRLKKDGGDFDGKTGATVTSRAVAEMTGKTAETFAGHRAEILAKFGATEVKK